MSSIGWEILAYIDEGYDRGAWWQRFSDRLTPDERKRLAGTDDVAEDYSDLIRPLRPRWQPGQPLRVTPSLEIRVGETRVTRRGLYRTAIVQVMDNRGGGRVTSQRIREELHEVTTIMPLNGGTQPEPQRVPDRVVKRLPSTLAARARYDELHAKDTRRRLVRTVIEQIRDAELSVPELERVRAIIDSLRQDRAA